MIAGILRLNPHWKDDNGTVLISILSTESCEGELKVWLGKNSMIHIFDHFFALEVIPTLGSRNHYLLKVDTGARTKPVCTTLTEPFRGCMRGINRVKI